MPTEVDKAVVNITKMAERNSDLAYWRSRSYVNRLEALEEIRSEYTNWKYDAKQGFQRVYRVTRLK